jgi:hypothetical protein
MLKRGLRCSKLSEKFTKRVICEWRNIETFSESGSDFIENLGNAMLMYLYDCDGTYR